jgi:hypothetical protein
MRKYICCVFCILSVSGNAHAQWRCDDWGAWMMDWGVSFWFQPITFASLPLIIIAIVTYFMLRTRHIRE